MQETGKENAKQDRKNNKKKWMILAVCAFAAAILLIGFIAGTWWMEKKAEQEYLAMQEKNAEKRQKVPEEEKKIDIPVDFDSLQKENPDIYAWITIPDTVIDYPIVQSSEDNAYYLNHSAEKTDSVSGAIYSENYNKKNFDDPITLFSFWSSNQILPIQPLIGFVDGDSALLKVKICRGQSQKFSLSDTAPVKHLKGIER
mgnify:CR=1 FL=1